MKSDGIKNKCWSAFQAQVGPDYSEFGVVVMSEVVLCWLVGGVLRGIRGEF